MAMLGQRLDKVLGETGRWSRKEAKILIHQGRVTVNGTVIHRPEEKIFPEEAELTVCGERIVWKAFCYLMMNKPAGVLTATEDRRQKTVLDLLPASMRRQSIAPVGRLDKDTEGLLLLTNDGGLTHRLLSPKYRVEKRYIATINGTVEQADVRAFAAGMMLRDGTRCLPAQVHDLGPGRCLVTLQEGKYHQVKRMLAACGKTVTALKRVAMGPLQLDQTLPRGGWRRLEDEEVRLLKEGKNWGKRNKI